MKRLIVCNILFCIIIGLSSCAHHILKGEGKRITQTLSTGNFKNIDIEVSSITTIEVVPGAKPTVTITGWENHIPHLKSKNESDKISDKLVIYSDLDEDWIFGKKSEIEIKVTVPELEGLGLNGSTEATIHGNIKGEYFKLDISGAGSVVIDSLNIHNFNTDLSGAGSIEIKSGAVNSASYQVSGAGKINAFQLVTAETQTLISGAGKAEVNASQKLTVEISGAGLVRYKGHPTITEDVSGAGKVTNAN